MLMKNSMIIFLYICIWWNTILEKTKNSCHRQSRGPDGDNQRFSFCIIWSPEDSVLPKKLYTVWNQSRAPDANSTPTLISCRDCVASGISRFKQSHRTYVTKTKNTPTPKHGIRRWVVTKGLYNYIPKFGVNLLKLQFHLDND